MIVDLLRVRTKFSSAGLEYSNSAQNLGRGETLRRRGKIGQPQRAYDILNGAFILRCRWIGGGHGRHQQTQYGHFAKVPHAAPLMHCEYAMAISIERRKQAKVDRIGLRTIGIMRPAVGWKTSVPPFCPGAQTYRFPFT